MFLWDLYDTAQVLTDDCATTGEKIMAVAGMAASVANPIPGMGFVTKIVKKYDKFTVDVHKDLKRKVKGLDFI